MRGWTTFGVLLTGAALATLASADDRPPKHGTLGEAPKVTPKVKPKTETEPPPKPKVESGPVVGQKPVIAVSGDTITINGKGLALPFERTELVAALGKPDREVKLANILLTWDGQGVFAYIKPGSTQVNAVSIALGRDTPSFWPKMDFSGTLTVDGAPVTANSMVAAINKAKKGKLFEKDKFADPEAWTIEGKTTSVTLSKGSSGQFNELTISLRDE